MVIVMNKYLISSKPDDYGASNRMVINCKLKDIKNNVYHYSKISDEEYEVLKKYLGDYFDYYDDFEGLEYFW